MKNNLVTEYWFNRPITYNKDKYILETNTNGVIIKDKKTDNIVFKHGYISMIKQISNTEFIAIVISNQEKRETIFYHFEYNELTNKTAFLYQNKYNYKRLINTYREMNNLYIMESFLKTTMYNPNTKKSLTLEDSTISDELYREGTFPSNELCIDYKDIFYIKAKVQIRLDSSIRSYYDDLIMLINTNTLEFNEFYSTKQNKIIEINRNSNVNFIDNYNETIKTDIISYLELLKKEEELQREQLHKKAINKLIKKKELKKI